jgi:hypothetical protein
MIKIRNYRDPKLTADIDIPLDQAAKLKTHPAVAAGTRAGISSYQPSDHFARESICYLFRLAGNLAA